MKLKLEELIKEKKRRQRAKKKAAATQEETQPKRVGHATKWRAKRTEWHRRYMGNPGLEPPAGELANILDGLDPDGYDKQGKHRSFVETGKEVFGLRRLSFLSRPARIGRKQTV